MLKSGAIAIKLDLFYKKFKILKLWKVLNKHVKFVLYM